MIAACRRTHSPTQLSWCEDSAAAWHCLHYSCEADELLQWLCDDDSMIFVWIIVVDTVGDMKKHGLNLALRRDSGLRYNLHEFLNDNKHLFLPWNLDKNLVCGRWQDQIASLRKNLGQNISVLSVTEFMLQCQYSVTNTSWLLGLDSLTAACCLFAVKIVGVQMQLVSWKMIRLCCQTVKYSISACSVPRHKHELSIAITFRAVIRVTSKGKLEVNSHTGTVRCQSWSQYYTVDPQVISVGRLPLLSMRPMVAFRAIGHHRP